MPELGILSQNMVKGEGGGGSLINFCLESFYVSLAWLIFFVGKPTDIFLFQVTKVRIPTTSKNLQNKSVPVQKIEKSPINLPSTENDTSESREKRDVKRARKLLREKKRKEKKQELKQNWKNGKKKEKPDPSKLLVDVKSETNNENVSGLSKTSKTTNKNKVRKERKKLTVEKRKGKKLKLKQNKQIKSSDPEAETLSDQTVVPSISNGSAKKMKRKSSMTLANEPEIKKKRIHDLSAKSIATSKNSRKKIKKPKTTGKILQASKSSPEKSDPLNDNSCVEESIYSSTEESPSKPLKGMEGWSELNLPDSILRALSENGFKKPTEIQVRMIFLISLLR